MKTLIITILIWTSLTGFPPGEPSKACTFTAPETLHLAEQLTHLLPEGMWRGKMANGKEAAFQFQPSGEALWFTYGSRGLENLEGYIWHISSLSKASAMLELYAKNGAKAYSFEVEGDCQSLVLEDKGSGKTVLRHEHGSPEVQLERLRAALSGSWENTIYPFDIKDLEGAYLKYRFYDTGKMERLCGASGQMIKDRGEWTLSNDGKHLIMQFEDGTKAVAEIKHLDIDEMVLTHVLACTDQRFATGLKDFFFNRH
jgi:hypothetical protein